MSLHIIHWRSRVLGKQTTTRVLYPESGTPPFPVLYLLHGLSDDSSSWGRNSRIEIHAAQFPMIVAMPDGYRGFYTDNEQGPAYARHFAVELPNFIERTFHARTDRGGRAIGGLSMGGYGAMRLGLGHPDRFCSIHSHSGALDCGATVHRVWQDSPDPDGPNCPEEMLRIFGTQPAPESHDPLELAKQARHDLPAILIDCGTDDFLLQANRDFVDALQREKIPHTYIEHPGGHDWTYWDTHVQEALRFHASHFRDSAQ
jgi:putative tributyrin esterase